MKLFFNLLDKTLNFDKKYLIRFLYSARDGHSEAGNIIEKCKPWSITTHGSKCKLLLVNFKITDGIGDGEHNNICVELFFKLTSIDKECGIINDNYKYFVKAYSLHFPIKFLNIRYNKDTIKYQNSGESEDIILSLKNVHDILNVKYELDNKYIANDFLGIYTNLLKVIVPFDYVKVYNKWIYKLSNMEISVEEKQQLYRNVINCMQQKTLYNIKQHYITYDYTIIIFDPKLDRKELNDTIMQFEKTIDEISTKYIKVKIPLDNKQAASHVLSHTANKKTGET
jgi:hypothetical protein